MTLHPNQDIFDIKYKICKTRLHEIESIQQEVLKDLQSQREQIQQIDEKRYQIEDHILKTNEILIEMRESFLRRNWLLFINLLQYYFQIIKKQTLNVIGLDELKQLQSENQYKEEELDWQVIDISDDIEVIEPKEVIDLGIEYINMQNEQPIIPDYITIHARQLVILQTTGDQMKELEQKVQELKYLSENIKDSLNQDNVQILRVLKKIDSTNIDSQYF